MKRNLLRLMLCLAIICAVSMIAFAQGRGRGVGQGRRSNVFYDDDYRGNRGRSQNWKKCGKFVNCHDARDGRRDGRGPARNDFWRSPVFVTRGSNGEYRRRYSTSDYWRRRHVIDRDRYGRTWYR